MWDNKNDLQLQSSVLPGSKFVYCILVVFQQELLSGLLTIVSKSDINHQGINLYIDGTVALSLSSKNVGVFEAFYNSVKVAPTLISCRLVTFLKNSCFSR